MKYERGESHQPNAEVLTCTAAGMAQGRPALRLFIRSSVQNTQRGGKLQLNSLVVKEVPENGTELERLAVDVKSPRNEPGRGEAAARS